MISVLQGASQCRIRSSMALTGQSRAGCHRTRIHRLDSCGRVGQWQSRRRYGSGNSGRRPCTRRSLSLCECCSGEPVANGPCSSLAIRRHRKKRSDCRDPRGHTYPLYAIHRPVQHLVEKLSTAAGLPGRIPAMIASHSSFRRAGGWLDIMTSRCGRGCSASRRPPRMDRAADLS